MEYILEVRKKRDWSILLNKDSKTSIKKDTINSDLPFGVVKFKDGKIEFLLDVLVNKEQINRVKNIDAFKQQAKFIPYICDINCQKFEKKEPFYGSFIDALIYIKGVFNDR